MTDPHQSDQSDQFDPNSISHLMNAALEYARQGLSIIPLIPGGKKPWIRWSRYETAPATPDEIRAWWAERPASNIGMVTGAISGLVVIDVDVRGGAARDIRALYERYPTGMISRTGGGGWHLFYRAPSRPVRNRVGQSGIDVRGDGGYVALPPSSHSSGNLYAWVRRGEPGPTPDFLLRDLERGALAENGPDESDWVTRSLTEGAGEGSRNDLVARLAGYFASHAIPSDIAEALLIQWNQRNRPPLPEREVLVTARSIYAGHQARLISSPGGNPNTGAVSSQTLVFAPNSGITGAGRFRVFDLSHFMSLYGESTVNWTIHDWLPEATIAFVVSPPGTFKTWLLLDMAISLATGSPFLGRYPVATESPQPVLLIQQEDFHGQTAERFAAIAMQRLNLREPREEGEGGDTFQVSSPPYIQIYVHPDRLLHFDDPKILADLRNVIISHGIKAVIIDPLYSAASTDEYMAKSAEQMFALKRIRDETGCSFIIAHHTKKRADPNAAREDSWGSQFLNAFIETGIQIRPAPEDPTRIQLTRHFKTRPNIEQITLEFKIRTTPPYTYSVKEIGIPASQREEDIVEWLREAGPHTKTEIATATHLNRSTVSRRVDALVAEGELIPVGNGGKYAVTRSVPPDGEATGD